MAYNVISEGFMNEEIEKQVLDEIENLNTQQQNILKEFVTKGFIDNLAMILAYMEPEYSAESLKTYPEDFQTILRNKMKNYSTNDAACLLHSSRVLFDAGFGDKDFEKYEKLTEKLEIDQIDLLNFQIEDRNPILCAALCEINDYSMDDLPNLDDRSIQKLLREVDQQNLAKALKNVSPEVKEKIFRNMSHRAASMLQEDMEFMGPIRRCDVIEAQSIIISSLKKLIKDGEIYLSRGFSSQNELIS